MGRLLKWARKRDTRDLLEWKPLMRALAKGVLPCSECGAEMPLADLPPLQMARCPKCEAANFVPQKVGNFWLVYPAGGGGMGSVYQAYHVEVPNKRFAVKLLARSEKNNPARIHALILEAETARQLAVHPGIVTYAGSGYVDGEYFFAMEYVPGDRLDELIDRFGQLPPDFAVLTVLYVLAAEEHIYGKGFLYRDLKPENILITPDGRAVLLDYGLCLPREQALNPSDEFVTGSPYYLPPERLWGMGEDAYSEIYSLGMVMYYALTGNTFFNAEEVEELAKKHISKMRLSVTSRMRGFEPRLVDVLDRMIQQEPEKRYPTFEELAADLYDVYQSLEKTG